MNLKEFVAETLKEIIDGIAEAQEHAKETGAEVAPHLYLRGDKGHRQTQSRNSYHSVAFDVAVTVQESNEQKGKGGLQIPWFNIGGELAAGQENGTISRIKFEVPVVPPRQKK